MKIKSLSELQDIGDESNKPENAKYFTFDMGEYNDGIPTLAFWTGEPQFNELHDIFIDNISYFIEQSEFPLIEIDFDVDWSECVFEV